MPFEYWVGGRYVRSRNRNSFVSLISGISMLGIAIAVTVLIVVRIVRIRGHYVRNEAAVAS